MKNPCIDCGKKGCGIYHDICPDYIKWQNWRQLAATRRSLQIEAQRTTIERAVRLQKAKRGKRK